ncbi:uncharacterized protein LOC119399770 [Rhipicephalus sanguineus]|uniref:uncharacterized protein LOC119399770 n=1 Tax=Rhipicephalus sanguineus TaxID=34632 RepID=UPI0020C1CF64|nr:uncharacterized protein LOC119399770 [Rhipicephalus sanguineus]
MLISDRRSMKGTEPDGEEQPDKDRPIEAGGNQVITKDIVEQFLRWEGIIHLQMMEESEWMRTDCDCINSKFLVNTLEGSERTLGCYLNTEITVTEPSMKTITKEELGLIEARVDFIVTTQDHVTALTMKIALEADVAGDPSVEFFPPCLVLEANSGCLLLSYGTSKEGKQKCLLWGLAGEKVNTSTKCYKKMESVCADNIYDMTEKDSRCERYEKEKEEEIVPTK